MGAGVTEPRAGRPADPDPASASTRDQLARCLIQLYLGAGAPAFRVLERESAKTAGSRLGGSEAESVRLGRAAVNAMLGARKFPGKAFLLTFAQACGVDLETDPRWGQAWDRLAPARLRDVAGAALDPWHQLAVSTARAERAESGLEQLSRQLLAASSRAEQAEADNQQLRLASLVPMEPGRRDSAAGPPPPQPLEPPDPARIGPFGLIARLGGGSMGRVYLGRSTTGRLAAVKTVRPDMVGEPGFRYRFSREVDAARRVSAMFTAPIVAAAPEAEMPWLATAYIPAPTLSQLIRSRGPLSPPALRWLAAGCAEALASIHAAGLVHGDLKPSNLLVAASGPLVIDFGMAVDIAGDGRRAPSVEGATPAYMAPELASGASGASVASDVFALGATLLFAATGHAPYEGETIGEVLTRLANEPPDLSGLPAELAELITGCLSRDPRGRPQPTDLLTLLGCRPDIISFAAAKAMQS